MASGNFERCLAATLKWEGGYSNHPDDPGGPTMRGVIQREYDKWRRAKGKWKRPVRQIEEGELRAIYRENYWDALSCEDLEAGYDLCVFDAGVNSGVRRARTWMTAARDIDGFCDQRLTFLKGLTRLWRVFGAGWRRRVAGIRNEAHIIAGQETAPVEQDDTLHAGMRGPEIRALQQKLRALGYPAGVADGIFGEQTCRAVILFQHDHDLAGTPGIWLPQYGAVLATAEPMLSRRKDTSHKDLAAQGDGPVQHLNLLQRVLAWLFGISAATQVIDADSVMGTLQGFQGIVEPAMGVLSWIGTNRWLIAAAVILCLIAFVRFIRKKHVEDYRNFTYQGGNS